MPPGQPRRERLDVLLVQLGLAPTRAKAQALVLAGQVSSRGCRLDKPGVRVASDLPLELAEGSRYVSRGGFKLVAALKSFDVTVAGRKALDVGSSTGGFTQVLLESGAERVIALDVGRGQLDWSLRQDPRVQPIEGVNARYLEPHALPYRPELAVIDVSFISLQLVLPPVANCLAAQGEIVALVKPQFEVGRRQVGRGGIVRDRALHREVLDALRRFTVERGWGFVDVAASALKGAEGNQEYFIRIAPDRPGRSEHDAEQHIRRVTADEEGRP